MDKDQFERLVTGAGLNLLSKYSPRFLISLYVPTTYGYRVQTGKIEFASQQALEAASEEEVAKAIAEVRRRLERAAGTLRGEIHGGTVVKVATKEKAAEAAINYPAH